MENYIVINGKKAELTEEQLKQLGIEVHLKKRRNPFNNANGFNDKDFANQVYLHELLNRKLLKYAWDNEAEDCEWDGENSHWHIKKLIATNGTVFSAVEDEHYKCCTPYFSKREIVEQAIEDVVRPFMAEHPEFVW